MSQNHYHSILADPTDEVMDSLCWLTSSSYQLAQTFARTLDISFQRSKTRLGCENLILRYLGCSQPLWCIYPLIPVSGVEGLWCMCWNASSVPGAPCICKLCDLNFPWNCFFVMFNYHALTERRDGHQTLTASSLTIRYLYLASGFQAPYKSTDEAESLPRDGLRKKQFVVDVTIVKTKVFLPKGRMMAKHRKKHTNCL